MGLPARLFAAVLAAALFATPASASPAARKAFDAAIADTKAAMMADPGRALAKADVALARAAALPPSPAAEIARATAQWLKAEAFIGVNRLDEARAIVAPALATAERHAPRTKLHGDLMRSQGAIDALAGKAQESLASYLAAFQIFRAAGEQRSQAIALQDIGQIYWEAGDYERTLQYYAQAGELYTADPAFTLTSHNNQGEVLRKLKRGAEAEREYAAALASARKLGSPMLEVRILSNLALAQVDNGRLAAAATTAQRAMRLAQAGEAAGWQQFTFGVAAKIAAAQGRAGEAGALLDRTFANTDLAKTELAFKEFHELGVQVFETLGDERKALQHLKAFQRLDSEARNLTASASSQLMSARFDFANQNLRISRLKQEQLESDVQIARQRGRLQSGALAAVGIIAALLAIGFVSLRRSRNEVRAANTVLSEVNVRLESALKAKTDFLATTSHEIRTPLNGILGMTQILLTNRSLPAETREQIQVVHGAGETMRALVDDILDVAKMETGELAVAAEPTRLHTILEETGRLWRGHAQTKGLEVTIAVEDVPAVIRSDPARLRQIVFNLVSNAVKFTPSGTVAITARGEDDTLAITVADTGIGIPADQLELIFEPFHQVDGGTTRQFSGTGLGLAICRKIALALGGDIAVASELGRGTTFTVRVPLIADDMAAPDAAAGPRTSGLLLVEANPMTQGVMRNLLEPRFPDMRCADGSESALEAIDGGREAQLLIEARSAAAPGSSPIESLARLIEHGRAAGMHVTVLVAPSDELPLDQVAGLGADSLVLKPVSGAQLLRKIDLGQAVGGAMQAAA
jgi:signal transduction histidine kinase/CheY-like chemotaxis protein